MGSLAARHRRYRLSALPPYLIRQLHEKPIVHPLKPGPVELAVALERAPVAQKCHRARSGLERGKEIEPESIELRYRLRRARDEQGRSAGRIEQLGSTL
jgi:hypothetical protein